MPPQRKKPAAGEKFANPFFCEPEAREKFSDQIFILVRYPPWKNLAITYGPKTTFNNLKKNQNPIYSSKSLLWNNKRWYFFSHELKEEIWCKWRRVLLLLHNHYHYLVSCSGQPRLKHKSTLDWVCKFFFFKSSIILSMGSSINYLRWQNFEDFWPPCPLRW